MYLFFDTETTGKPKRYDAPISDVDNYPRLVQLGFIVVEDREILLEQEFIVKPVGFEIPAEVSLIHGITNEKALADGEDLETVVRIFDLWIQQCDTIIGHNVSFDLCVFGAEYWRLYQKDPFEGKKSVCTMKSSTNFCGIPSPFRTVRNSGQFKYPKLAELYKKLFDTDMGAAHTALQDIRNTVRCYFELVERGIIK